MEAATPENPRAFRLPLRKLTMSERRIMASKFGVNWDAVEVDMADAVPMPEDPDNPTEAEQRAATKAFVRIVGPNEKFALLYIAVKREIPTATEAEIVRHADAGDWVLDLSQDPDPVVEAADPEVASAAPLPPPISNETS
jgi:hypothetical protein